MIRTASALVHPCIRSINFIIYKCDIHKISVPTLIEILQVQISKSKSEVAKSKNVGRDKYVLRVRFDNWAPLIDQREKWVELLVQSALSQVCLVNFVCRFSRNYGQIWPNSGKSHYRPQKNIKFLTEKSPLQKTFSKNRELVKISNDYQIARWEPNSDLTKLHMSLHRVTNFVDVVIPALMWTA